MTEFMAATIFKTSVKKYAVIWRAGCPALPLTVAGPAMSGTGAEMERHNQLITDYAGDAGDPSSV
jgi:hypothetical protein